MAALAVGAPSTASATASAKCTVSSRVTTQWTQHHGRTMVKGFTAMVRVTNNTNRPVPDWSMLWNGGAKTTYTKLWDAKWAKDGKWVAIQHGKHDATIYPHRTLTLGFTATGARVLPSQVLLNGVACK